MALSCFLVIKWLLCGFAWHHAAMCGSAVEMVIMRSSNGNDLFRAHVSEDHQALLAALFDHFREGVAGVSFTGHLGFRDHNPLPVRELFLEPASAGLRVIHKADRNG